MNRADYLDQPFEVSIETLALCNARCTFCPYPTLERKGERMSSKLIFRLLGEMSRFEKPFFFSPFKVNEPLLDSRFIGICQTFNEATNIGRLRLFTNGSALTPQKIASIAKLRRVEHLWISLNSHVAEDYETLMGLNFDNTVRKLDALHLEKEADQFWQSVVISKVAEDDSNKNLQFVLYCTSRWPLFRPVIIKRDGWLGYVEPSNTLVPQKGCVRWFELSVMANGKVALCCMDGTGEFAIGDITTSSLLDVYNAPHWRERREYGVKRQQYEPCQRCTY